MKYFVGICVLAVAGSPAVLGQAAPREKWIGTWILNTQKSPFGTILHPDMPGGWTFISQTLSIEQTVREIRLSSDAVISDNSGSHSGHEENDLSLDGWEAVVGLNRFSFRRIDDSTFDIINRTKDINFEFEEVLHFTFSSDGRTLTETKTQTDRELVPDNVDKTTGAVIKTSMFVLVFSKSSEAK